MVTKKGHVRSVTSRKEGAAKVSVQLEDTKDFLGVTVTEEEAALFVFGQRVLVHLEPEPSVGEQPHETALREANEVGDGS
jgi:hypothetical protein